MAEQPNSRNLKLLIDTKVLLPVEPTPQKDRESNSDQIANLLRIAAQGKHEIFVHPRMVIDLSPDTDEDRKRTRSILLSKYRSLPEPPSITPRIIDAFGDVSEANRDFVDHALLSTIDADAVDFIVTEDRTLRAKAKDLGLAKRVATVQEALSILLALSQRSPRTPPAVRETFAYSLDVSDPIFASLRADYEGFDEWLVKCKREHRRVWVVEGGTNGIAALCLVNSELRAPIGIQGQTLESKILKICTLKVSEHFYGYRYGELLLKTAFSFAYENNFEYIYVTCFEKHDDAIALFEDFGFEHNGALTNNGDQIFVKKLRASIDEKETLSSIDYHLKFGPRAINARHAEIFIIPIQPQYHDLLFPEASIQRSLLEGIDPFGNSIRKAYLCHAGIRKIKPGAVLMFYRSEDAQAIRVIGIAEDTLVSDSAHRIAQFVGKRTVYRFDQIAEMCRRNVLAILFRQGFILQNSIDLDELINRGVVKAPPQSITSVPEEGRGWLLSSIDKLS
jgi:GNAT superfamily N-acetyltransferase